MQTHDNINSFIAKIQNQEIILVVAGLGWMGLSLASLYANAGFQVIGVDVNPRVLEAVSSGNPLINEPGLKEIIKKALRLNNIKVSGDLTDSTSKADVVLICVPTLVDQNGNADYRILEDTSIDIGKGLKKETCIIVQSTCAPGITRKSVQRNLVKFSSLSAGRDFYLAYSPIRAMIGQVLEDIQSYPKIVGGVNEESLKIASLVTAVIAKKRIVEVEDIETAEAVKIFETVYRDVNIALANEFAKLCEIIGLDYFNIMKAANTQPYSHLHLPGIGVGGHCLPLYPYMLLTEALETGVKLKLVQYARKINESMPMHAVSLIIDALKAVGKPLVRRKIAILGVAYRANVKEVRYSPALELIQLLEKRGAHVTTYDPMYTTQELKEMGLDATSSLKMAIKDADCTVITVAHDEFKQIKLPDLSFHMRMPGAVVDGVSVLDSRSIEKGGLIYRGIGKGA